MPRRRRPRSQNFNAHASSNFSPVHEPPRNAVVDSDAESASLDSNTCEDYVSNIIAAQHREDKDDTGDDYEQLDLAKGLSLNTDITASTTQSIWQAEDEIVSPLGTASSSGVAEGTLGCFNEKPQQIPACSRATSEQTISSASHAPSNLTPGDQATWEFVEAQAMEAYLFFEQNALRGASFQCAPMSSSRTRLAMHRCAEAIGARSHSQGTGKARFVTLTWNKDGSFGLSEQALRFAVRCVLSELFQPPVNPKDKRAAKRALRRAKKLEREAKFADAYENPELVEALVANNDWDGLDKMFEGLEVPGPKRKKKKDKKGKKGNRSENAACASDSRAQLERTSSHWDYNGGVGCRTNWNSHKRTGAPAKPLEKTNKGFALLEKMGWQEGEGLGTGNNGRTEPLQPDKLIPRAGLGKR